MQQSTIYAIRYLIDNRTNIVGRPLMFFRGNTNHKIIKKVGVMECHNRGASSYIFEQHVFIDSVMTIY